MKSGKRRTGVWSHLIETITAWEKAMDYTPYDYALERLNDLERQVASLRDELRMLVDQRQRSN